MPWSAESALPTRATARHLGRLCAVMAQWRRLSGLALLALLVSACTLPAQPPATPDMPPAPPPAASAPAVMPAVPTPPAPPPTPEAQERQAAQRLLRFHERVRTWPPGEVAREITRLEARLQVDQQTTAPTAISGPAPDATDGAAPQTALELALLLAQQRQNGDLARALALLDPLQQPDAPTATQPLARLLHARLAEQRRLEEQLERQAQSLRDLQRRADQLAAQLEALRTIERSLNTRPPGQPLPAAPAPPR